MAVGGVRGSSSVAGRPGAVDARRRRTGRRAKGVGVPGVPVGVDLLLIGVYGAELCVGGVRRLTAGVPKPLV